MPAFLPDREHICDPVALTEQYNAAAAGKRATEAGLKAIDPVPQLTADDVRAMVTQLGEMTKALDRADRNDLAELKKCVRGGTRTLTTRLELQADALGRTL